MEFLIGVNPDLCSGCQACCVACMDQNGLVVEGGCGSWRKVMKIEKGTHPHAKITYVSMSCLNCNNPKCLAVCPVGAVFLAENCKTVQVDSSLCIGCRRCASACPIEAPQFGAGGKMYKCGGCKARLEQGLLPACVRTCPTGALEKQC